MIKETILVVDDSPEIRTLLRDYVLVPEGYRVQLADSGKAALQAVKQYNPDLILLDINLPDATGLQVLQALNNHNYTIPVIIITSDTSAETILEAFRLGAGNYLSKPFALDKISNMIDEVLTISRWQQERERLYTDLTAANLKLQKQVNAWEALDTIGRAITATLDEATIQQRLMEGINQLMRVEAGSLFLIDEATGELALKISLRDDVAKIGEVRLHPGQGIAGWVVQHGKSALVLEAYKDKRFFSDIDQRHTGFLTHSILAVPLIGKGKVIGVIEVLNPSDPEAQFNESDQAILETLAASVAVAVENARLHNMMRQSITVDTLQKTIVTLSHYINNSLMSFSMLAGLLQDKLETMSEGQRPKWAQKMIATLRIESARITAVLSALKQTVPIQDTVYNGDVRMIDIEKELKKNLESLGLPHLSDLQYDRQ